MSNIPEQIPMPKPPAEQTAPVENPYANRHHDNNVISTKNEVMAVAGLLGSVSGELGRIDQQNVGGDSQFIKAKKINPRETLNNIVGVQNQHPSTKPANTQHIQMPAPTSPRPPVAGTIQEDTSLTKRVTELERIVESYKKVIKFKRGISYNINTTNIKGEFRSPGDILDVVSSEMAKGTKTITLKLNDTTKNR